MAWPKGKPRTGHINKDGTPHQKKGAKLAVAKEPRVLRVQAVTKPEPRHQAIAKPDPTVLTIKKTAVTSRPIVEPCPNCGNPYADGGYCGECPWVQYDPKCPHCRKAK